MHRIPVFDASEKNDSVQIQLEDLDSAKGTRVASHAFLTV
jgi:hypothetical protein